MNGFHIDLNTYHFTYDYLRTWLEKLADLGYDTIVWELENAVAWDTCPECTAPEAFSKAEIGALIDYSRTLGMEPIPLLQTLGHVEYVLKCAPYQHLACRPGAIDQYDPLNKAVIPFVHRWIDEYVELFDHPRRFHIGLDETWWLDKSVRCKQFLKKHSLSELYVGYVNQVARPLIRKGITPIVWADMLLAHPAALDRLDRRIMLFDWNYWLHDGVDYVHVWELQGNTRVQRDAIPAAVLAARGKYLYPAGDEPGKVPEPFWSADFLADHGFDVVTCPSSACSGDSVFAPRNWLHLANTIDSFRKGRRKTLCGSVLTSWTVRCVPWELQAPAIEIPFFLNSVPDGSLAAFQKYFVHRHFGQAAVESATASRPAKPKHLIRDDEFFRAVGLLSKPCFLSHSHQLGIDKSIPQIPPNHVDTKVNQLPVKAVAGMLGEQRLRLAEYRHGLKLFQDFRHQVRKGHAELDHWILAARNLINRAQCAIFLLACRQAKIKHALPPGDVRIKLGKQALAGLRKLRRDTDSFYQTILKPDRRQIVIGWFYDSMEVALQRKIGAA